MKFTRRISKPRKWLALALCSAIAALANPKINSSMGCQNSGGLPEIRLITDSWPMCNEKCVVISSATQSFTVLMGVLTKNLND